VLSPKRDSVYAIYGPFYLDSELLQPGYTRTQKSVDALDNAVQVVILLRSGRGELYMQRTNQAARVLGPKLGFCVRCKPLNRSELIQGMCYAVGALRNVQREYLTRVDDKRDHARSDEYRDEN